MCQQADVTFAAETESTLKAAFPTVANVGDKATAMLCRALMLPVDRHLSIGNVLVSAGLSNQHESDQLALLKLVYACEVPCLRTPPSPKAV